MLRELIEIGLNYKVGIMTASSPFVVKTLGFLQIVDANITQIGLWFSVLLTITLILGHYVKILWQSRKSVIEKDNLILDGKRKDLENEELKLKVELLKLELREKQEENKE